MAINYRFNEIAHESDGSFRVKVILLDDENPSEQTELSIPFASGSTIANVNVSVRQKASFAARLARTSVKDTA